MTTTEMTIAQFRRDITDALNRVNYGRENLVLTRRGTPVAIISPMIACNSGKVAKKVDGGSTVNDESPDSGDPAQSGENPPATPPSKPSKPKKR